MENGSRPTTVAVLAAQNFVDRPVYRKEVGLVSKTRRDENVLLRAMKLECKTTTSAARIAGEF